MPPRMPLLREEQYVLTCVYEVIYSKQYYLLLLIAPYCTTRDVSTSTPAVEGGLCMYVCIVITYSKSKDQPGKVANPARGQLNKEN